MKREIKRLEKLDYSAEFKTYIVAFMVLGPIVFMLPIEFICIGFLLFFFYQKKEMLNKNSEIKIFAILLTILSVVVWMFKPIASILSNFFPSYFKEEDVLPKGISFNVEDAKKVIQSNPFFKQDDIEYTELYNCPAHTKGADFYDKEMIIRGLYKNKGFLMSELIRLDFHQENRNCFSFITFAIKGRYKTKGDFLVNTKSTINPSVAKTKRILIPNDYGFLVYSDKDASSIYKIEKILKELSIIKGKYPNLSFTLLIRKNIISFTLLGAKNFKYDNLNVFFDFVDAVEPLQSAFPSILSNQTCKENKKIHLIILKILIGLVLGVFSLGIIAAGMEGEKGFLVLFFLFIFLPVISILFLLKGKKNRYSMRRLKGL